MDVKVERDWNLIVGGVLLLLLGLVFLFAPDVTLLTVALMLMIALSYNGIRKVVSPVEDFSDVAKKIAQGEFNAELPQIHSEDELKELHDSFEYLQTSLVQYIDELKSTTARTTLYSSVLNISFHTIFRTRSSSLSKRFCR